MTILGHHLSQEKMKQIIQRIQKVDFFVLGMVAFL